MVKTLHDDKTIWNSPYNFIYWKESWRYFNGNICNKIIFQSKRDLITGLKTRTIAGRPNWDRVFKKLHDNRKGKVTVFFCGPPQLGKILKQKCTDFGFEYRKEDFWIFSRKQFCDSMRCFMFYDVFICYDLWFKTLFCEKLYFTIIYLFNNILHKVMKVIGQH